ncbi:hypothetical protein Vadar_009794 [Vaccinium darrowii]|uniref:Uncharacterized protein n=1 Tax=Vaccinium darrowii TaxID=229202 RepID=A0ACB7XPG7_9ERIC|nr:hypothetical protein Vadar_009794 [Vaccinium darrowii]
MGTPWPENQCAHRKRKIEELIQAEARGTAGEILSEKPTGDHDGLEKLLEKRFTSFTKYLSHVSLCRCKDCEWEVTQIPKRVRLIYPISDLRSENYDEGCKRPAAEDRRGSCERSVPSKTISDSGSPSRRISSETISTQNTTSTPSSAASGREESWEESNELVELKKLSCDFENLELEEESWEESNELVELKKLSCDFESLELEEGSFQIENSKFWILKHLDISKCNSLDHLPKEISNLLGLEVLKGFVVGYSMGKKKDSCSLEDLAKLTRLTELSIDIIRREDFPVISELRDLNRLKKLHKLGIDWGKVSVHKSENITKVDNSSSEEMPAAESTKQENHGPADTEIAVNNYPTNAAESGAKPSTSNRYNFLSTVILCHLFVALSLRPVENDASPELPPQLEELHLKCLPRKSAPDWLRASKRNKIKKLHIEEGPLSDLGQLALQEKSEWQVEILRLKFLKDLEINWTDLRKLFPKLIYFEKVGCPKLQFFPCDEQGVWMETPEKI